MNPPVSPTPAHTLVSSLLLLRKSNDGAIVLLTVPAALSPRLAGRQQRIKCRLEASQRREAFERRRFRRQPPA